VLSHARSLTPSTLILAYTLLKGLFSGATLRSYALIGLFNKTAAPVEGVAVAIVQALSMGVYFVLCGVEMVEKRRWMRDDLKRLPQVLTSSILSRAMYIWLLPFLWRGRGGRLRSKTWKLNLRHS